MSKNNIVLVSSYIVPDDLNWTIIWEKSVKLSKIQINSQITGITEQKRCERLYLVNN